MEILEKVQQLKAELDGLRPLDTAIEARVMQKLRLDWNYHSNKLEGNTYSYGETKMLLMKGLTAGGKPVRDSEEITGHDQAITFIIDSIKQDEPLTEGFIRHLHKLILVRPFQADAKTPDGLPTKRLIKVGEYKTEPNHVETQSGDIFYFAEPIDTPAKMQELVQWVREKIAGPQVNAVLIAAEFHYRFVRIHPFDDGNGRLARLLMNFVLMKYGYPPIIIRTEDKDNYIAVLEQADFKILKPFVDFVAQNLARSLDMIIRGARGEEIEEPEDLDKEIALLKQEIKNVGERIEIPKNKEILLEIFENSIHPLIDRFVDASQKFDEFYLKSQFLLFFGGGASNISKEDAITRARDHLIERGDIANASLEYNFINFRRTGFDDFDYSSRIDLKFDLSSYLVQFGNDFDYRKLYSQQLTPVEIETIVRSLSVRHKELIREKLEKIKSS